MKYLYVLVLLVMISVVIFFKSWSEDFAAEAEAAMEGRHVELIDSGRY